MHGSDAPGASVPASCISAPASSSTPRSDSDGAIVPASCVSGTGPTSDAAGASVLASRTVRIALCSGDPNSVREPAS